MAQLNKFFPKSNDPFLLAQEDMALAKFGHINTMLKYIPITAIVSTELSVASSTTLTNVPDLTVNVEAGAKYMFKAYIETTTATNSGFKMALGGTSTWTAANASVIFNWIGGATSTTQNIVVSNSTTNGTAITTQTSVTAAVTNVIIDGTLIFDTTGTFTIQFAQGTSQSTACKVLAGSAISLTRIA